MPKGLLIIGNYPPPYGGVPKHLETLVPVLVKEGWNIHVVSGGNQGVFPNPSYTIYKRNKWGRLLQVVRRFMGLNRGWPGLRLLVSDPYHWLRYSQYIAEAENIVQTQNISLISAYNLYSYALVGVAISRKYGIPLVVTNFGELYSHEWFFKKHPWILKEVVDASSVLLAMSSHCGQSYSRFNLHPQVKVIPYGVDLQTFSCGSPSQDIFKNLGLPPTGFTVLFVGRLVRDMGLDTFMSAAESLLPRRNDVNFVIVGQKGELLTQAISLAKAYPGRVILAPNVKYHDLPDYYRCCSLVAAPTAGERACGSLSALEGMATGKPVLASRTGGIPEIVIDGETGVLVTPGDPMALANAIERLADSKELVASLGRKALARARDYYSEGELNSRIAALFDAVGTK